MEGFLVCTVEKIERTLLVRFISQLLDIPHGKEHNQ